MLGHSFVHRLDTIMKATDRENFEFAECWTCRLFGTGGLIIERLFSARDKVARFRPGLMMTDIGTNDIDVQDDRLPHPASWPWTSSNTVCML